MLVEEALAQAGLDVDLVLKKDGEEMVATIDAIDAGETPAPDLVLLDLNLPRQNGEAVLKRLRASKNCRNVAVIIVTSSDAPRDRELGVRFGAREYFRKPSDYAGFMRLGEIIRRALEQGTTSQ
jgi:DNA-binding response OmpR family regulator